jgi:hypothetical protein
MKATATITMNATVLNRLRQTARLEKRSLSQQLEMLAERHFEPSARRSRPRTAKAERIPA